MLSLPVDSIIPEVLASLRAEVNLVVEAPPGAGKTTRIPPALLCLGGEVVVLEPRRLAARLAARRVAQEMGEEVGETVGYQVRFEDVSSARTRLRYVTEGVLTRRLLSDPELSGVTTVVLDEFHERHLDGDVALALLRRLQRRKRPDLRLVVMSATLDGEAVARYLDGCPRVRSEGRLFPISVRYRPHSAAPLGEQVANAVEELVRMPGMGDVLVFLPGAGEIRAAMQATAGRGAVRERLLLPLHGELAAEEQDRAVLPAAQRKVVFSTNVAESSLTIEGVTAVVDSGLARIARDNPYTGLPTLEVARISKAAANQRAGRAGRTAPGTVIRLYPEEDFVRRPEAETPEIARRELSTLLVWLRAMQIEPGEVPWLEAPPAAAVEAAEQLLERLEAGRVARELARLPLHPRLGTLVLACPSEEGCRLAAALAVGERAPSADVFSLLDGNGSYQAKRLAAVLRWNIRLRERLRDEDLRRAVLRAFPDRVVRGHMVALPPQAGTLERERLLVAVEVEQRRELRLPLVRLAAAITPELLFDVFPERIREESTVEWNRTAERVEARSALLYGEIVIEESRAGAAREEEAAALLAEKALEAGWGRFTDKEEFERLLARCAFAARYAKLPAPEPERALRELCVGRRSFEELAEADLAGAVLAQYTPAERQVLEQVAPDRMRLPSGRMVKVQYAADKEPLVASRLQDFFGWQDTPRLANGAVALTVQLLAPSQRPVQTTRDLKSFWQRLYPQLRRELARRYPKHRWPEDPLRAGEL